MTPEGSGGGKLAELVTNHFFRHVHIHVRAAIVNQEGMPNELWRDRRPPGPCLDWVFPSRQIQPLNFD